MLMNIFIATIYFSILVGLSAWGYKHSVKKLVEQMDKIEE